MEATYHLCHKELARSRGLWMRQDGSLWHKRSGISIKLSTNESTISTLPTNESAPLCIPPVKPGLSLTSPSHRIGATVWAGAASITILCTPSHSRGFSGNEEAARQAATNKLRAKSWHIQTWEAGRDLGVRGENGEDWTAGRKKLTYLGRQS